MIRQATHGFTLIETLVALAIYAVLIATLVVVNRGGLDTLSELESRALARRALANVITEFRLQHQRGKQPAQVGRYTGQYTLSQFTYDWQIQLSRSQQQQVLLLDAHIRPVRPEQQGQQGQRQEHLATLSAIW